MNREVCHYCCGQGQLPNEGYADCPYCDGTGVEIELDYDYEENSYERLNIVFETSDGSRFDEYDDAFEHEMEWLHTPIDNIE
jgi:RecJ-like exonuclease